MAPKTLADLLDANGAAELTGYLSARGIKTCDMLARAAKDEDSLELKVLTPFINGWKDKKDNTGYKAQEDELMLRPALIIAWEQCVADRQAYLDSQEILLGESKLIMSKVVVKLKTADLFIPREATIRIEDLPPKEVATATAAAAVEATSSSSSSSNLASNLASNLHPPRRHSTRVWCVSSVPTV